ncbi:MAG: translocation/assembly module TamB domain-containing protein [Pseudomonadota bacterium]
MSGPALEGIIKANALTYENQTYGTRLSDMRLSARFDGDQLVVDSLTAAAGKGRVEADGTISLSAEKGFPMDLAFSLNRAQLARSQDLAARATGKLTLTKKPGERSVLAGTLLLPETRYTLAALDVVEVPELTGVRFASQVADASAETATAKEPGLRDLRLDLRLVARDELFVTGLGLDSEWQADLRVTGTSADPRLSGSIDLIRGSLDFAGRAFAIEEGRVRFAGGASLDPTIAITATERIEDVAVAVNVSGKAFAPQFEFSSTPGLPQDEIVSRILFGSSIARLSALEAVQLAQSLNALNGSGGGLNPLSRVRSLTGVDRLRLLAADEANGRGTALAAGQYISDDIYVEVITDARGFTATQLELSLSPTLSVLSQASGVGATNVNLRYRKDY